MRELSDLPLRHIEVEDFRRLAGPHSYDLDAPVVLIHGPNGSGKTSILSALELGLTGQITGIDDGDNEQFKHLPHTDALAASVRVDVAAALNNRVDNERLSISRTRGFSGPFALAPEEARFYRERCYLDQASLGRLLEIYQHTDKNEESALARFVNELLGLEQLDSLIDGLYDATHLTRLRNRAPELGNADQSKKDAALLLSERTRALVQAQEELSKARKDVLERLREIGNGFEGEPSAEAIMERALAEGDTSALRAREEALESDYRELLELGGQLNAVRELDSTVNIEEASERAYAAESEFATWRSRHEPKIQAWDSEAEALGLEVGPDSRFTYVLAAQLDVERRLKDQENLRSRLDASAAALSAARDALHQRQAEYDAAKENASNLVEGLVALRPYIAEQASQKCPVCDRDFSQVGHDLGEHVDSKIRELSEQSEHLQGLRGLRDSASADLSRQEAEHAQGVSSLVPDDELAAVADRGVALKDLLDRLAEILPAIDEGANLATEAAKARSTQRDLEGAANVNRHAAERLARIATSLELADHQTMSPLDQQQQLLQLASSQTATIRQAVEVKDKLASAATRLATALERESDASRWVSDASQEQNEWDERTKEGVRRQGIAKELHTAATAARSKIIQRVFTNELNELWRDLFTRLAPRESYVPAFGTVATNKIVEPKLITRHKSGSDGGTPRLMLSQGNLNTAALSLFLALHLSVKNTVGCLVFDDPVQAMDEVHIAQFAALIRILSKNLGRQVVVAVHERELFDYLALELSPAFEGDELITIRLGEPDAVDGVWHREIYRHDDTIAV